MKYKLYYEESNDAIVLVSDGVIIRYDSGVTHGSDFLYYFLEGDNLEPYMLLGIEGDVVLEGYDLIKEDNIHTAGAMAHTQYLDAVSKLRLENLGELELLSEFELG